MAENSKIEWTDHTFNPWIGCTKVAAGCTHCYAEAYAKRYGKAQWGPHGTRVKTSGTYWRQPLKWNREAEAAGVRKRVFCASLADVFEEWEGQFTNSKGEPLFAGKFVTKATAEEVRLAKGYGADAKPMKLNLDDLRRDLFALIDATPHLDWLLLTKRPENIRRMWPMPPKDYGNHCRECGATMANHLLRCKSRGAYRPNCWLLTSIATQEDADRNVPELLACRDLCPVLGLSCEPLLGPVDLEVPWEGEPALPTVQVDWVIVGGESGHGARPCETDWIRSIVSQCRAADVPCFVKQLGADPLLPRNTILHPPQRRSMKLRDKKGGDWSEWPEDLRVRQFPHQEPAPCP